jgi:hydroxyacylglutathione hydrolase
VKRRAAASSSRSADHAPKAARQSKLAKEHNISAAQENEIREAFGLFAQPAEGEKEGLLPIRDVKKALVCVISSPAFSPPVPLESHDMPERRARYSREQT